MRRTQLSLARVWSALDLLTLKTFWMELLLSCHELSSWSWLLHAV